MTEEDDDVEGGGGVDTLIETEGVTVVCGAM